ncbi:MAG TPA: formyltransferase family protein, partial [Thermomicrobiales bacterium]|nr:formyltransferase family protein [Thermomicrobiales bacterium]
VGNYSKAVYDVLAPHQPDLLIMAGFLRRLLVFPGWEGRILNIHPALLPDAAAYAAGKGRYGDRVHEAVLARGDRVSGATVHVVTDVYDDGPPLLRSEVPVEPGDTAQSLAARVFAAECELYPEAIRQYMAAHPELKRSGS